MKKGLGLMTGLFILLGVAVNGQENSMKLDFAEANQVINKNIYGQFAEHLGRCIYDGIWVGPDSDMANVNGYRQDVLEALKELQIPVLRWPGGCFADTYHWKDGVGPVQDRPNIENVFWGGVIEDNSFGTHEFLNLCEIIGADPYISANVGSGTVKEMVEWIEYMTADSDVPMANWRRENGREKPWDVKFLGIGNESWGCGGDMTPEYYSDLLRQYSLYARQYGKGKFERVGCGANGDDYRWTDVLMKNAGRNMDALSVHYYTIATGNWGSKSAATGFDEGLYIKGLKQGLRMDEIITKHSEMMDKYDPEKRVGMLVDEWGIWTDAEPGTNPGFLYQQNSMRDALIAATTFDIFHKHADRVQMANIAQVVNVLQAMILTEEDKMILTPTYHVFRMYAGHQDAVSIPVELSSENYSFGTDVIPAISGTASQKDGKVNVNLSNTNPHKSIKVTVDLSSGEVKKVNNGTVLTAPEFNSVNTFDDADVVSPKDFSQYKFSKNVLEVTMPPLSVVALELE
ncbi:alpha-N-arabinofuranosidase [Geofilum rubicundum]|uniref:non-reducing end alpha-L-arabinofuranosidase n=1 Tax=Geofilum rubicundum JCM 15548 TaxID=1236989 RepID=A0A0E9M0V0_9BACT|nr:alpha-L-arabinofuranosidase C-terminal domain-containing protein [Geofilum rubicundum]GAO30770.1 alpha-N-arabinofuranosidase 2 [Geofilum rubicundum JCM 15548]